MRKSLLVLSLCLGLFLAGCSGETTKTTAEESTPQETTLVATEAVTTAAPETEAASESTTLSAEEQHDLTVSLLRLSTDESNLERSDSNTSEVIDILVSYYPKFSALTKWDDTLDELNIYFGCATYLGAYFEQGSNGNFLYELILDSLAYLYDEEPENFALNNMLLKTSLEDLSGKKILDTSATQYSEGQYKVGGDIPAGEYVLFAKSTVAGYFCLSKDSNDNDIITNENFSYNSIITVREGEYFTLKRCYAVPIEEAGDLDTSQTGTFKIGVHLPAGEYKVTADNGKGYYCVYNDGRQDDIEANDNFSGSSYVTVSDGQYLVLSRCHIDQ
ncbi:hypothetical protein [Hominifimenecus sp. rT4P-3]|uniref:hypothetical protein n=1 Tax=Hominifimenecus sp. rT4P-3 TaxID=3242979 RepID=UPI003DA5D4C4